MAFQWMRRVLRALAPAALLALAACGSSTTESQFVPTRVVVFGDALADIGNTSNSAGTATRYTVNDSSPMWPSIVALDFGAPVVSRAAGGTDYAVGNARVTQKPDAAGSNATPTVKEQVDAFLAANASFKTSDLVIVSGGISDVIVQVQALRAGTITSAQAVANVTQAAHDLAAQALRAEAAGATHILVVSIPDLRVTPWAAASGQQALISSVSATFNNTLEVDLANHGDKMLFVDIALLFNLMSTNPTAYGLTNSTAPVCTTVDPGPGIGIGPNQVNSALCTPATIVAGASYLSYMWADAVYPTPTVHSQLGSYLFGRVHARW